MDRSNIEDGTSDGGGFLWDPHLSYRIATTNDIISDRKQFYSEIFTKMTE